MDYDLSIFSSGSGQILINDSKYAYPTVLPNADFSNYIFKTLGFKTFWIRSKIKQRNQREKQGKFIQCVSIEESVRNNPILKLKEGSSEQVD